MAVPSQPAAGANLSMMVAPVTGNREVGVMRSEIKQGQFAAACIRPT